jgi:4-hydroxybenzoate polyprenyltransferase
MKNRLLNYLGQFRPYSLAELILALFVLRPNVWHFLGAVLLWCGSIAVLESCHADWGREKMPAIVAVVLSISGLLSFGVWQGLPFVLAGIVYSWKKQYKWGLASPAVRGFQMFFLLYPLWFLWPSVVIAALLTVRNYVGDRRDVEEDRREGVTTWPVVMDQKKDEPFGHLLFIFLTTTIWWWLSELSGPCLIGILAFEAGTYWLTPRESNKNVLAFGRKILRYIRS